MSEKTFYLNQKEREQLKDHLAVLLKSRKEVVFAYIYGSFTEGLPFHDLDLGVYIAGIKEQDTTSHALDLAQILSSAVEVPVDVRILNFAPISFLYYVFRGDLVFERDEEIRSQIAEKIVCIYLDIKPVIYRGIKEAHTQ